MGNNSENERQCPWCDALLSVVVEEHTGSHAKMKISRCSGCKKIISARTEGAPDRIIKKELVEGGLL